MISDNPRVYGTRNLAGEYAKLEKDDIIKNLKNILMSGEYCVDFTGKIKRRQEPSMTFDTPWWHTKATPTKRCHVDHNMKFYNFGYIPPRCQECWKVVAMPTTLKELFTVKEVQRIMNKSSKCGIELRFYTPRNYGAYWYTNSLDQGLTRYHEVRKLMDEINPNMKVLLKRGCTEFELVHGASPYWALTAEQERLDEYIEDRLDSTKITEFNQPDFLVARLKKHWIEWACACGDETYKEYTDGVPLYEPSVTYHDVEDIQGMKEDMMLAKAGVLHGLDEEKVGEVRGDLYKLVEKHQVGSMELGNLLGYVQKNPLISTGVATY